MYSLQSAVFHFIENEALAHQFSLKLYLCISLYIMDIKFQENISFLLTCEVHLTFQWKGGTNFEPTQLTFRNAALSLGPILMECLPLPKTVKLFTFLCLNCGPFILSYFHTFAVGGGGWGQNILPGGAGSDMNDFAVKFNLQILWILRFSGFPSKVRNISQKKSITEYILNYAAIL